MRYEGELKAIGYISKGKVTVKQDRKINREIKRGGWKIRKG